MFENSDLYRMNWRKCYFDAFHDIIPNIHSSGESDNILITNYRSFSNSVKLWEVVC